MTERERLRKQRLWDALAKRDNELRGLLTTFIDDLERVAQERPSEGEERRKDPCGLCGRNRHNSVHGPPFDSTHHYGEHAHPFVEPSTTEEEQIWIKPHELADLRDDRNGCAIIVSRTEGDDEGGDSLPATL